MLAAVVIQAAIVMLLLHLRFYVEITAGGPTAVRDDATSRVTYVSLSSVANRAILERAPSLRGAPLATRTRASLPPAINVDTGTSHSEIVVPARKAAERPAIDWKISKPGTFERSSTAVIDSIIRVGIRPGNDSLTRARRSREHAVDWTVAVNGERYGMSPGEIHLGKISLQFPLVFAEPLSFSSDRRRESRLVVEDTRSHAARALRDAMFDSAVASIARRRTAATRHVPK